MEETSRVWKGMVLSNVDRYLVSQSLSTYAIYECFQVFILFLC